MTRLILPAVAALLLAIAAPAQAQTKFVIDGPYTVQESNGIIAILIGQFTPPIGSNKGS